MFITSTVEIIFVVIIVLLIVSLCVFLVAKYMDSVEKRKAAERYRGKGALLPIANIHVKSPSPIARHPALQFGEPFRKSFHGAAQKVPEIRITFPEEDELPPTPGIPGKRMSRVVVVQVGESGAAYVTSPPAYETSFGTVRFDEVKKEKHQKK
jgi:hypothetical protein